jgi:hypothetical protein
MEFLNLMGSQSVKLWLAQSTVIFFLVSGLVLLAIGISLIVNSAGALRFFGNMNRWVSMRRVSKPLEIPHDTRQTVQQYRYWFAVIFVAGGAFAIFSLLTQYDVAAITFALGLGFFKPAFSDWLIDSVRWILILGNLLAIVTGLLLAFSPATVVRLEARGSHWYSERKITKGADQLNLKLDAWVEAHPRPAGWSIVAFALTLIGAFGLILPKLW